LSERWSGPFLAALAKTIRYSDLLFGDRSDDDLVPLTMALHQSSNLHAAESTFSLTLA
jgi:hypothetical protein